MPFLVSVGSLSPRWRSQHSRLQSLAESSWGCPCVNSVWLTFSFLCLVLFGHPDVIRFPEPLLSCGLSRLLCRGPASQESYSGRLEMVQSRAARRPCSKATQLTLKTNNQSNKQTPCTRNCKHQTACENNLPAIQQVALCSFNCSCCYNLNRNHFTSIFLKLL